jgi:hypothetical protein
LRAPDGRLLAILGEAHLKLSKAAVIGRGVVELRGVGRSSASTHEGVA